MKENKTQEKELFSDIAKAYPRTDLKNYKKVLKAVSDMKQQKKDTTKTNIAEFLGTKRELIEKAVGQLSEFKYLNVLGLTRTGRTILFLSVEGDEKTYWGREDISEAITKNFRQLLREIRKEEIKKALGKELTNEIENANDEDKMLDLYKRAVILLNEKEIEHELLWMQLNSKAYRFETTTKGDAVLAKGA